jgi:DNA-binding GntR family transcriptional regulator
MDMNKAANTVRTSTYERIKRDIIFGVLAPGTKLKLDRLKSEYETSVPTLREALNRLSADGFVQSPEQRGFLVTPVSAEDLVEIANLRILLECHALEQSIEAGDTDWEADLVAAYHRLNLIEKRMQNGENSQKELWKRYDWEFHLASIKACSSQNLLSLHSTIYDKYLRYQMLVLTYRGEAAIDEHHEIFNAVLERDKKRAVAKLKTHIKEGLTHTLAAM